METLKQAGFGNVQFKYIPGTISLAAGSSGVVGTDANPAILFQGLTTNIMIHNIFLEDTTLQIFDQITGAKVGTIALASNTSADFNKITLAEIIKKTTADFDVTHPVDIAYTGGASLAGAKKLNGGIMYTPVVQCC